MIAPSFDGCSSAAYLLALASATAISGTRRRFGCSACRGLERVRGGVDVSWIAGRGTVFTIEAPLTLATVRMLCSHASRRRGSRYSAAFVERMFRVKP